MENPTSFVVNERVMVNGKVGHVLRVLNTELYSVLTNGFTCVLRASQLQKIA